MLSDSDFRSALAAALIQVDALDSELMKLMRYS